MYLKKEENNCRIDQLEPRGSVNELT